MSSPAQRPTIVHLLAEARRNQKAAQLPDPKKTKTIAFEELKNDGVFTYNNEPFTGLAVAYWSEGQIQEEQRFLNGKKEGLHRLYSPSAVLLEETPYRANLVDGVSWTWHDNGQMAREMFAIAGVPLFRRTWDDRGEPTEDYKLDENDWRYARVLKKLDERNNLEA